MLSIYYGRESLDRERFLFEQLHADTLFIVPDQYTLQAEKAALKYTGKKGLLGSEITSFGRLGQSILKEAGGGKRPMIDRYGRHMLLAKLMGQLKEDLPLYGHYAANLPFLSMLNDFISQMKQYGVTPEILEDHYKDLGEDRKGLKEKLQEIGQVFQAYQEAIAGRYVDTEDMVSLVCQRMAQAPSLGEKEIVIFGFDYFTPGNLRLISSLLTCSPKVQVVLTWDPSPREEDLFQLGSYMMQRLKEEAEKQGIAVEVKAIPEDYTIVEGKNPALRFLEKEMFAFPSEKSSAVQGITLVKASTYYSEAETAAQWVQKLVQDQGYRYRDIVLISNDTAVRSNIYRRVFADYGIPLFADEKRSILHSPVSDYLLSVLGVVTQGYRRRDVIALLKTGMTPYPTDQVELFERYCETYRISGHLLKKPFEKGKERMSPEDFQMVEALRQDVMSGLLDFGEKLREAASVEEKACVFYGYLEKTGTLLQQMERLMEEQRQEGHLEQAAENAQIFNMAMHILEQMVQISGREKVSLKEFMDLFLSGMEAVEIGVLPPAEDGLSMGTMERTRCSQVRAMAILGANAGVLPAEGGSEGMLTEEEKEFLLQQDLRLCRTDRLKAMEEDVAIYRNLTKAQEQLFISCASGDESGKKLEPSSIYEKIQELFPSLKEEKDCESTGTFAPLVGGEESTFQHLAVYLKAYAENALERSPQAENIPGAEPALREQEGPVDEAAAAALRWYWEKDGTRVQDLEEALTFRNVVSPLGQEEAAALYGFQESQRLVLSPTRLEKYGRCPFEHFVEYGLRPERTEEYTVKNFDLGNLYHEALQRVAQSLSLPGKAVNASDSPWMTMGTKDLQDLVNTTVDNLLEGYREGLLQSSQKESYRGERLRKLVQTAAQNMVRQVREGVVENIRCEVGFGRGKTLPPIVLETWEGGEIAVEGKIDRIDNLPKGMVKVVDYKSKNTNYAEEEARAGYTLQLFLYLKAAAQEKAVNFTREPVGAFYFHVDNPTNSESQFSGPLHREEGALEALEKDKRKSLRMVGFMLDREDVLQAVAGEDPVHADVVPLKGKEKPLGAAGLSLLEPAQFQELLEQVHQRIVDMAGEIRQGRMDIAPRRVSQRKAACTYCSFKDVCMFDRTLPECRFVEVKKEN